MKLIPFFFTMVALLCTATIVQSQTPAFPQTTPNDQILFYKKLATASRNNTNHIPQILHSNEKKEVTAYTTTFDTATKKFRVSIPCRAVMEYPQTFPQTGN